MSEKLQPSQTAGMNIAQRILHVGGRNNAAGYVEFGSIQAVEALVRQVIRDLPELAELERLRNNVKVYRDAWTFALAEENLKYSSFVGYKLVPIEPTPEMLASVRNKSGPTRPDGWDGLHKKLYQTMVKAAPEISDIPEVDEITIRELK